MILHTIKQGEDDLDIEYDPCIEQCERTDCTGCIFNGCDCKQCLHIRNGKRSITWKQFKEISDEMC